MLKIERYEIPAQLVGLKTITGFCWIYKGLNTKTGKTYNVIRTHYPDKQQDQTIRDCIKLKLK